MSIKEILSGSYWIFQNLYVSIAIALLRDPKLDNKMSLSLDFQIYEVLIWNIPRT